MRLTSQLILYVTLSLAILTGCQAAGPSKIHDKHTGLTVTKARNNIAADSLFYRLNATPFHSSSIGYGIETGFSGPDWQFFREAWSHGKRLPFDVTNQQVIAGHILEFGSIRLTKSEFMKAAEKGMDFKLVGKNGSLEGKIPASAFREVLDLK